MATGVGVYAVYTYAQVIVGQEYLRLAGNVERFFPLLLAIFVLGEVLVVLGWRQTRPDLPAIAEAVHSAGALLYVDGVHLTPHAAVDVAVERGVRVPLRERAPSALCESAPSAQRKSAPSAQREGA